MINADFCEQLGISNYELRFTCLALALLRKAEQVKAGELKITNKK